MINLFFCTKFVPLLYQNESSILLLSVIVGMPILSETDLNVSLSSGVQAYKTASSEANFHLSGYCLMNSNVVMLVLLIYIANHYVGKQDDKAKA